MTGKPCNYMDYGVEAIKDSRLWLCTPVWLQAKVRERGFGAA